MIAATLRDTFAGARLLEPIERHQHIQFIERRIAGERYFDPPLPYRPSCPSSAPTYRGQWFDDPNFDDPHYCVPLNHVAPPRKPVAIDCLLCDESFRTLAERKKHSLEVHGFNPKPTKLVWDHEIKTERCYTGLAQGWIPLTTGDEESVETVSFGYRFDSDQTPLSTPLPQPPPSPFLNASLYDEFHIPALPRKSAAKTEKGVMRFRERREIALLQSRVMYQIGEMLLKDVGFKSDHTDRRNYCKQCGASFFHRLRGKLRCYDCGWALKNSEKDGDSEGLKKFMQSQGLGNDGSSFHIDGWLDSDRETTIAQPNDVSRVPQYVSKYNPFNQERGEIEPAVRRHPDFLVDSARHHAQITNTPIIEIAAQMGLSYDPLRQQLSRGNKQLDLYKTAPHAALRREIVGNRNELIPVGFNISIHLNDTVELKYLGTLTDSPETYLKALDREQKKTIRYALRYVGRKARTHGWTAKQVEAEKHVVRARIEDAYRPHFEGFQREVDGAGGTLSQFPHEVEGRSNPHYT